MKTMDKIDTLKEMLRDFYCAGLEEGLLVEDDETLITAEGFEDFYEALREEVRRVTGM